ncbi:hypothetical protein Cyagr_0761 [Cyanobium gracile PCC 6307]|uniref:Uncharacterized protein n=1 Tax=Cyanobium gracile (strain ATCC 27147 / PCC 6307) TaxID=292564 RepID=K9P4N8_CYAGP|nr:hypothetical protein Cyagr_0761 [Cyanobium gracile PCC 6307]
MADLLTHPQRQPSSHGFILALGDGMEPALMEALTLQPSRASSPLKSGVVGIRRA